MAFLEKIYDHSPIFAQNIMCSAKGYSNNRDRYGKVYRDEREFLKKFDSLTLEEQKAYQLDEMRKFVRYAYENSEFYHELYKGIDIDGIKSIDDLKRLPIVDKEMLRENIDRVTTKGDERMTEGHTGGTTGKSLVVKYTSSDHMKRMAMLDHFKSRLGFEHLKMRRATFNAKHIVPPEQKAKVFWRYNAACRQMIFSAFHITEENMKYYVEELNRFKPQAIDGFFTSMCDIAGYIERHGIKLEFTPKAIFPTSETLNDEGRERLERVFGCKVYDQYASSEGAPFVTECKNQVKHMELSTGVFEHMEGSDEILVTSFTTHGTPLIRYRIGDVMVFGDEDDKCSCGSPAPIVKRIDGRKNDFLYTANGTKISCGISSIFKTIPNAIIKAQLVQYTWDKVTAYIEIDPEKYKPEYDDRLRDEFKHKFGAETELEIKHVDSIPREASGKFRLVVNKCE